jgi:hypothetical protein
VRAPKRPGEALRLHVEHIQLEGRAEGVQDAASVRHGARQITTRQVALEEVSKRRDMFNRDEAGTAGRCVGLGWEGRP